MFFENDVFQFFSNAEGYASPELVSGSIVSWKRVYQYKDHLGNVRLSYSDVDSDGTIDTATEIIEESNYYPFGGKHKGYNNVISSNGNPSAQKYKYNGKELEESLGLNWLEYGWRNYDPYLGRWHNIDQLAESYFDDSPYVYATNNPIYLLDVDGRYWINNGDGTWTPQDGDSAATLARDANISYARANELVQKQYGPNRIINGKEYSNIHPTVSVVTVPEHVQFFTDMYFENEIFTSNVPKEEVIEMTQKEKALEELDELKQLFDDLGDIPDISPIGEIEDQLDLVTINVEDGHQAMIYSLIALAHLEENGGGWKRGSSSKKRGSGTSKKRRAKRKKVRTNGSSKSKKPKRTRAKSSWDDFRTQTKGTYSGPGWQKNMSAGYAKWKQERNLN